MRWLALVEWGFDDERELECSRDHKSCPACHHLRYVTIRQCQVLGSSHLKQGHQAPGSHPLKRYRYWSFCSEVDMHN